MEQIVDKFIAIYCSNSVFSAIHICLSSLLIQIETLQHFSEIPGFSEWNWNNIPFIHRPLEIEFICLQWAKYIVAIFVIVRRKSMSLNSFDRNTTSVSSHITSQDQAWEWFIIFLLFRNFHRKLPINVKSHLRTIF